MSEVLLDMAMSLDGFSTDHFGKSLYPAEPGRKGLTWQDSELHAGAIIMDQDFYQHQKENYSLPVFVLTESPTEFPEKAKVRFIENDILSAVKKAKIAAHGKNVVIVGGVRAAQLAIEAGVVDVIKLRLMHVIEGKGTRLFEHLSDQQIKLEMISSEEFKNRTDISFKLVRYKYIPHDKSLPFEANQSYL